MTYIVAPEFYQEIRKYFTQSTIQEINDEYEILQTALVIAQQSVREYANSDPGLPYTSLTQDLQWARLSAMQHKMIMDLRAEFWPEWDINPLETPSDVLTRHLVERDYCMILWDELARHYLHLTLAEIALLPLSDDYDTAPAVVEIIHLEAPAGPEEQAPEPAMSFWL